MELSVLKNYQQSPTKIIKNQRENKNKNNTFYCHEFIHFIADLIGPLSIFHILLSNKYFDVFTKSSKVYMDQIFYKKMYSQQSLKVS